MKQLLFTWFGKLFRMGYLVTIPENNNSFKEKVILSISSNSDRQWFFWEEYRTTEVGRWLAQQRCHYYYRYSSYTKHLNMTSFNVGPSWVVDIASIRFMCEHDALMFKLKFL